MFNLQIRTKEWVFVVLAVCAVLFSSTNPGVGYAQGPSAGPTPTKAAKAPKIAIAPGLGTAGSYAVLGGSTVTNVPAAGTVLTGNLGVWPGLAITGFPPGIVVPPGTIHAGDAAAQSAQTDLTTAYNAIGSGAQPCGGDLTGLDLGGAPANTAVAGGGVFCFSTSAQLTGVLTLSGNHVWIFQIGSSLTTASNSSVVLTNGASACNVFWQVGTSSTLGTNTSFNGNILALSSITLNNGAKIVSGRALARNGAVTLDNNTINTSACPGGVTASGVGATKIFSPNSVTVGGIATLTIALSNANGAIATITSFTDNLPGGMVIATPSGASNTCGGTLTATAGSSIITLTGGSIPAASGGVPGICTITVRVIASIVGNLTNTLLVGALVTSGGNNTSSSGTVLRASAAPVAPSEVPESDTLLLLGGGLGGLATWLSWQHYKVRARRKQ